MSSLMSRRRRRGSSGIGWMLLGAGALLLLGTVLGFGFWGLLWPAFIIVPGLAMFYGVKRLGRSATILTVPATMVTTLGLMLFIQNLTGLWGTWAYAWTLLFPGSLGLGLAVYGELARKPRAEELGENMAKVGLGMFLVGAVLNVIFGVGGWITGAVGGLFLPLLLIGIGISMLRGNKKRTRNIHTRPHSLGTGSRRALNERLSEIDDLDLALQELEKERAKR